MVGNKLKQVCKTWLATRAELAVTAAIIGFVFFAPRGAFAIDATDLVVSGGGKISFTNAAETNWVANASGGQDFVITFREDGSYEFSSLTIAKILAVGGGGGAGGTYQLATSKGYDGGSGGGGAGAFVEVGDTAYSAETFDVTIGAGGTAGGISGSRSGVKPGTSGTATTIVTNGVKMIEAPGGGAGGGECAGLQGGSGGGGSMHRDTSSAGTSMPGGGVYDAAYGNEGGEGNVGNFGGGGGGAGGPGMPGNAASGGVGGTGRQSDITVDAGTPEEDWPWYAGGGAGGNNDSKTTLTTPILGGAGGGGNGGVGKSVAVPTDGEDGTGGGGGGSSYNVIGGNGGSGIVIVRISMAVGEKLEKPKSKVAYTYDGEVHYAVPPLSIYEISGDNAKTEPGFYYAQVKPANGLKWTDDTTDPVTVQMIITEAGTFSGEVEFTGAPVSFVGATETNWVRNADGNFDFYIKFTGIGSYTLPGTTIASLLAVGGGGGAGGTYQLATSKGYDGGSGGGGAGAMVEIADSLYTAGTFMVNVGAGGAAGLIKGSRSGVTFGENGEETTVTANGTAIVTAIGGGGGGGECAGREGGSGGGGSMHRDTSSAGTSMSGGNPVDASQGNAGGEGNVGNFGGGGGGAGGPGAAANAEGGGVGGMGRQSAITVDYGTPQEDWPWYAGGGAGGNNDSKTTLTEAIAGGKGGGGQGGVGKGVAAPGNGVDGTGGGGGGSSYNVVGGRGGNGVFIIRISMTMNGNFERPDPVKEVTYNGKAQFSVKNTLFYTVTGDNIGTNVGEYVAHVKLNEGFTWPDGKDDQVDVTLKIVPCPVTFSNLHLADWEYRTPEEKTPNPTCTVEPNWVTPVYEYAKAGSGEWSAAKPTNVGEYEVRASAPDSVNYTFTPAVATFRITKIHVTISDLKLRSWMYGTPFDKTPKPSCTVTPPWAAEYVVYAYAADAAGPWSPAKPTELGTYWVKADMGDPDSFDWEPAMASFKIVSGLGDLYTDYVEITVGGYSGVDPAELLNYPCKVTLSEESPVGFLYSRASLNEGNDLAFTKEDGRDILPYEVETWNTNGESVVWVKLEKIGPEPQTIRLYWHVRDGQIAPDHHPEQVWSDWTKEEAEAVAKKPVLGWSGPVSRDGYLVNYWVKMPILSKIFWDVSDAEKGKILQDAEPAFEKGRLVRVFTNVVAHVGYDKMPVDIVGSFRVSYYIDDPAEEYLPLECHVDYAVSGVTPWDDLKGSAPSLTLSGRVMLANDDDIDEQHAVRDQSYWQTREVDIGGGVIKTNDVFWTHEGETTYKASWGNDNLMTNSTHRLKYIGEDGKTNVLWRFENVRIGNDAKGTATRDGHYYLPWSSTGMGISSYDNYVSGKGSFQESGCIVMRNTYDEVDQSKWSVVYSPCYTNGIGTIYFDAVNAQRDYLNELKYRIVVEVATATSNPDPTKKIPTDENARGPNDNGVETDLGYIRNSNWKQCEMIPLLHSGAGSAFVRQETTKDLNLSVNDRSAYGLPDNFYRICVKVNERGACRFRIRRVSAVPMVSVEPDQGQYLVLDNIIVSYPNMSADVFPCGEYDANRAGKQILGQAGAMTVPFPAAGQGEVFARGRVEPYVNDFAPVTEDSIVLRSQFYYRWRYLNQAYEPAGTKPGVDPDQWNIVELWPADGLTAREPLTLPKDEGDIEFWYRTFVNAPSYAYFDYSGSGLGLKGADGKDIYSDVKTVVTNRIRMADYDASLPSAGKNWFFRLRAGASDYEGVRLITREKGSDSATTNEMELVGNGLWRGCVQTATAVPGGLQYRLEAVNRQTPSATAYARNVTCWNAAEDAKDLPANVDCRPAEAAAWGTVPCDAKTGYLMFRLDEQKQLVYVARADCQNFNRWASAIREDGKFVGNSTDTNSTTYIAQQYDLDWSKMEPSVATNSHWSENFDVGGGMVPRIVYPRNQPFAKARSMNGWDAEHGMWTWAQYAIEADKIDESFNDRTALQLQGCGIGGVEMKNASDVPAGIDQLRFTARVAQFNSFEDFTYFNGKVALKTPITSLDDVGFATDLSDITFATTALMTEDGLATFNGDASLSLVANYHPQYGCYELRVSLGSATSTAKLELYRWSSSGGGWKSTLLSDKFDTDSKGNKVYHGISFPNKSAPLIQNWEGKKGKMGGLFISVCKTAKGVNVKGGLYRGSVDQGKAATMFSGSTHFSTVTYYDASSEALRLQQGTFGVLARNCPGMFENPIYFKKAAPTPKDADANKLLQNENETVTASSEVKTLTADTEYKNWIMKARMEQLARTAAHGGFFGFQAKKNVSQQVAVQYRVHDSGDEWQTIDTKTVSGFVDTPFTNIVRSTERSDVRLQVLGTVDDPRNDVVLSAIELTQWVGQSTPNYSDNSGFPEEYVYTSAWVNEHVEPGSTNRTVLLQPTRATKASDPVALRTLTLQGLGVFHLKWRNADEHAVAKVQIARDVTPAKLVRITEEASDGSSWETVETLDFGKLGASGLKTVRINMRHPTEGYAGVVRVVIDRAVTAEAIKQPTPRTNPAYGMVEITDAYVWDLPAYDMHSWIGWNFRTEGWNGTEPGPFSNLSDGGSEHGMSGLLNNTLDASTLADDVTEYEKKAPHVQSPTFGTNCIGAVDFRARLYGLNDLLDSGHPALVTIYGARGRHPVTGEPDGWEQVSEIAVSNGFYSTFSQRFKPSQKFFAIRFAVKGVPGVKDADSPGDPTYDPPLRVALDDICIYERPTVSVSFRKLHVRPFRNAESMKGVETVKDITSVNEQPLAGEAFGFQAEVSVDSDEVLVDDPNHPITVDLWYYPSAEPWGFANWKDAPEAVKAVRLVPALGEKLIFRSVGKVTESMCPPQILEKGEGYRLVQYHLVVRYYDTTFDEGENELSSENWSMPEWNTGFEDPNARPGAAFSGFTLLESIAPKRAWINEIGFVEKDKATSEADQWVEIAVPSGVDMTDWTLRLYDSQADAYASGANKAGLVGTLMTFGKRCPSSKSVSGDPSHYDFYVVKGPKTKIAADATWPDTALTKGSVSSGILQYNTPYGFELVRPTGVVEHRVVAQGWNIYKEPEYQLDFWPQYEGTNLVRLLNEKMGVDNWVWAEEDRHLVPGATLGVVQNQGGAHEDWKSPLGRTPGAINEGQYIDPNWFVYPNGGYFWINAIVQGSHMRQIIGNETNLVGTLTVQEGATTSIVYEVDRWYQLESWKVSPRGGTMSEPTVGENRKRYYTLTIANVSNQTDVTASADVDDRLLDVGVTDDNPYKKAILKWLEENDFAGDEIILGKYRGVNGKPEEESELGINDLYWLDLDPTCGGWELWGGMGDKPGTGKPGLGIVDQPIVRANPSDSSILHTNVQTTVWLMITNTVKESFAAYPPYRLQGLANEQSDTFEGQWTSETFKVEMQMSNKAGLASQWHALRQFVFNGDSFRGADDEVSPFAALIEVTDPFSRQSPAWEYGWWKYAGQGIAPFTRWTLNTKISPAGVSTLKKDDTLTW